MLLFSLSSLFPPLCFKQGREISLCNCQFLRFIPKLPVFCIRCLSAGKQFRVLSVQILYFWDPFHAKLIKRLLGCLMKRNLFPVCLKILLTSFLSCGAVPPIL